MNVQLVIFYILFLALIFAMIYLFNWLFKSKERADLDNLDDVVKNGNVTRAFKDLFNKK